MAHLAAPATLRQIFRTSARSISTLSIAPLTSTGNQPEGISAEELFRVLGLLGSIGVTPGNSEGDNIINSFNRLLERLSAEERELVLLLVGDYFRCTYLDYDALLRKAITQVDPAHLLAAREVIVLPLAETGSNGEPKSASTLIYPLRHGILPFLPLLDQKPIRHIERIELLNSKLSGRQHALLLFVDDFIGSGQAASKTLSKYRAHFAKKGDIVVVLALVAQEQGLEALKQENVPHAVAHVRKKGISDSLSIGDKKRALEVMDEIERRLGVEAKFLRGYGGCESLVTMIRTPNNTFPVFWLPKTSTGVQWPAPFRR